MFTRKEYNVSTGESREIEQVAFTDGDSLILLDLGVEPPEGYRQADPDEVLPL